MTPDHDPAQRGIPDPDEDGGIDLDTYTPISLDEAKFIGLLATPKPEDFEGEQNVRWLWIIQREDLFIANLIHRDYPSAVVQIQCVLIDGQLNIYTLHNKPEEESIPHDVCDALTVDEVVPHLIESYLLPKSQDKLN